MRNLLTLWEIILENCETKKNPSIYQAIMESDFTEEEGESVFKDAINDDSDYNNTLNFINSRVKYHRELTTKTE